MKLLEDVPSAVTHRAPQRRTGLTLVVTLVFLLVAAVLGVYLVASDDGSGGSADAGLPPPEGTLADWAAGATDVCTTVAAEHPVMADDPQVRLDPANVAAVADGMHVLVRDVRQVPLPTDEAEQERAADIVATGERADETWGGLTGGADEPSGDQLTEAAELTASFVAGVNELGATCAPIG